MNRTNDRHQMATARYAVFFADISGYTALLDSSRRAIQHIVDFKEFACLELTTHGGNVIDRIGDHIIALFDSRKSCVSAAVAVQQLLHVENQSFPPNLRLHFRVALHYGHVSLYQAEHHGPALNIASRMQEVAPPGGILFSDDFMDCVRSLNFAYRETGDYQFKNLTAPLKTYSLLFDGAIAVHPAKEEKVISPALIRSRLPRVIVASCESQAKLSIDTGHAAYLTRYLSDALVERLTALKSLRILASQAASYGDLPDSPHVLQRIRREYQADFLITLHLFLSNTVQVKLTLIRLEDGSVDSSLSRTLSKLGSEAAIEAVAQILAKELETSIIDAMLEDSDQGTISGNARRAYDFWISGKRLFNDWSDQNDRLALEKFRKAVRIEPTMHQAYAMIAAILNSRVLLQPGNAVDQFKPAIPYYLARRATHLDPLYVPGRVIYAWTLMMNRRFPDAKREFDLALELSPYDPDVLFAASQAYTYLGLDQKAALLADQAGLNTDSAAVHHRDYLATILFAQRRYEKLLELVDRRPSIFMETHFYASIAAREAKENTLHDWHNDTLRTMLTQHPAGLPATTVLSHWLNKASMFSAPEKVHDLVRQIPYTLNDVVSDEAVLNQSIYS